MESPALQITEYLQIDTEYSAVKEEIQQEVLPEMTPAERRERDIAKKLIEGLEQFPDSYWKIKGADEYGRGPIGNNILRLIVPEKKHEDVMANYRGPVIDIQNELLVIAPVGMEIKCVYRPMTLINYGENDSLVFRTISNKKENVVFQGSKKIPISGTQLLLDLTNRKIGNLNKVHGQNTRVIDYDGLEIVNGKVRVETFTHKNLEVPEVEVLEGLSQIIINTEQDRIYIPAYELDFDYTNSLVPNIEKEIILEDENRREYILNEDEYEMVPYFEGITVRRFLYPDATGKTISYHCTYKNLFANKTFKFEKSHDPNAAPNTRKQGTLAEIARLIDAPSDDELFYTNPVWLASEIGYQPAAENEQNKSVYYYEFLYICPEYTRCSRRHIGNGKVILTDIKLLGTREKRKYIMPRLFAEWTPPVSSMADATMKTIPLRNIVSLEIGSSNFMNGRVTVLADKVLLSKFVDPHMNREFARYRPLSFWDQKQLDEIMQPRGLGISRRQIYEQQAFEGLNQPFAYSEEKNNPQYLAKIHDNRLADGDAVAIRVRAPNGDIKQVYLVASVSYNWRSKTRTIGQDGFNTNSLATLFSLYEDFYNSSKGMLYSEYTHRESYAVIDNGRGKSIAYEKDEMGDIQLNTERLRGFMKNAKKPDMLMPVYAYQLIPDEKVNLTSEDFFNNFFLNVFVSQSPFYQKVFLQYDYFNIVKNSRRTIANHIANHLLKISDPWEEGNYLNPLPIDQAKELLYKREGTDPLSLTQEAKNSLWEKHFYVVHKPDLNFYYLMTAIHNAIRGKQLSPDEIYKLIIREIDVQIGLLQPRNKHVLYSLWKQAHDWSLVPAQLEGQLIFAYSNTTKLEDIYKVTDSLRKAQKHGTSSIVVSRGRGHGRGRGRGANVSQLSAQKQGAASVVINRGNVSQRSGQKQKFQKKSTVYKKREDTQ